jgi:TIR domain-containing protein
MGLSKKIFISYVEEDGAVAHEIAAGLESQGYSSWYYERDCPAGADYFEETFKAISDCEAMIVLISPRSLPSDQVTREIVRAVESSKATLPLLLEISHDDFTRRRPGWKQAMAAANATRIPPDRVPTIIPALVAGLSAKGIQAETNGHTPPAPPPKQNTGTHGTARPATPAPIQPAPISPTPVPIPPATARVEPTVPSPAPAPAPAPVTTSTRLPSPAAVTPATQQLPWKAFAVAAVAVVLAVSAWAIVRSRKPKPIVVPPPPTTATIVLQYAADRHKCTPDLNLTIAGAPYHPTANPFAATGVKIGAQEYAIDGVINCPGRHAIKASGSGAIDVHEGAVFDLAWQAKPGGGASTVDIIRVMDNGSAAAADNGSNADNRNNDSQDSGRANGTHTAKPVSAPVPTPAPVTTGPGQQMYLNAQNAYNQGRYFAPFNDSALHWAIQSRNAGNQNGKALEAQIVSIYKTQVKQLFLQQNYPAALQLNAAMQSYYPGDQGLLQDQQKILAAASGRTGGYQAPVNGQAPVAPYPPGYPPQYQPRPGTRPPTSHP